MHYYNLCVAEEMSLKALSPL